MNKVIQIILPAFLRRTMRAYALKAQIRALGGDLQRIGRSRNWQIKANREQLQAIIDFVEASHEASWLWLAKKLREHIDYSTFESILYVAKNNPGITINQLVAKTNCTLVQARKALDEIEFSD